MSFDGSMDDVGQENEAYFETSVNNELLHSYDNVNIDSVDCQQGI